MIKDPNEGVLLYASDSLPCPYLPDLDAITAFVDPKMDMSNELYGLLLSLGFRRSGNLVYRPQCQQCNQCLPVRLSTTDFTPNRSQRRNLKLHSDTHVLAKKAVFDPRHLDLYNKYLAQRHSDSDMGNATEQNYMSFLTSDWSNTQFFEFYHQQQLFAVAVADVLPTGLSAVYTFFDPDFAHLSPGQYAILWLLNESRRRELAWLYLGYWVPGCDKMSYKSNYRPLHVLLFQDWRSYPREKHLPY